MEFLVSWSKNPKTYEKRNHTPQDAATEALKSDKKDENNQIEVGFVDGLFELYKLRMDIAKVRAEIISTSVLSQYRHKFGPFLFHFFISFRSTTIGNLIQEKKK